MSANSAVRARPTMTDASSSGLIRAGIAWSMQPSASITSDSSAQNSFSLMSLRSANGSSQFLLRGRSPLRHHDINPRERREQKRRRHDEYPPQPEHRSDDAPGQRPQRVAEEVSGRRRAIDEATVVRVRHLADQRVRRGNDSADE